MTNQFEKIDYEKAPWTVIDEGLAACDGELATRDYWIMKCLLQVDRREIWRDAKHVSLNSYMTSRMGWDPHTTAERLRTARALEDLPLMTAAMLAGTLRWTAARELTRVATRENEAKWLAMAKGKTVKAISMECRTRHKGQNPEDERDPDLEFEVLRLECKAGTYAVLMSAIEQMRLKLGPDASDAQCLAEAIEEKATVKVTATYCPSCLDSGIQANGVDAPVSATKIQTMLCDAQVVGTDGEILQRHIPSDIVRAVKARAKNRCELPICPSRRYCRLHHLKLFSAGGKHTKGNLIYVCSGHHDMIHSGQIWIEGPRVGELVFTHADGTPLEKVPDEQLADAYRGVFIELRAMGVEEQLVHDAILEVRREKRERTEEEIFSETAKAIGRLRKDHESANDEEPSVVAESGRSSHVGLFTRDPGVEYVTAH